MLYSSCQAISKGGPWKIICSEARLMLIHPFFTSSIAATMDALFHFNLFWGDCGQGEADVEWRFHLLDFFCIRLRGITLNAQ